MQSIIVSIQCTILDVFSIKKHEFKKLRFTTFVSSLAMVQSYGTAKVSISLNE